MEPLGVRLHFAQVLAANLTTVIEKTLSRNCKIGGGLDGRAKFAPSYYKVEGLPRFPIQQL